MNILKGKSVSPGIVIGEALLYSSKKRIILKEAISPGNIGNEIRRFNNSVRKTRAQLKKIKIDLQKTIGKDSSLIIETLYYLLEDNTLIDDIKGIHSSWVREVLKVS